MVCEWRYQAARGICPRVVRRGRANPVYGDTACRPATQFVAAGDPVGGDDRGDPADEQ